MAPVFKEVMLQPNIFLDLVKKNDVCCKKNHQGSRFMIESGDVFSTEGYESTEK